MTTEIVDRESSEQMRDYFEENISKENMFPIHHKLTIDVIEFVNIQELLNTKVAIKDVNKAREEFLTAHRVLNQEFLDTKLLPIFEYSKMPVLAFSCNSTSFNYEKRRLQEALIRAGKELEKELENEMGNTEETKQEEDDD